MSNAGQRIQVAGEYFDVRLYEVIDELTWTIMYIPDEPDVTDLFYLYSRCGCGTLQLRLVKGYPMLVRPGPARSDFVLHNIGEGLTRTPGLNVLRHDTMIICKYEEYYIDCDLTFSALWVCLHADFDTT